MKKILTFFVCIILITAVFGCASKSNKPFLKTGMKNRPLVVGYYVNDPNGYNSLHSLQNHAALLNEIHPLWYHVKTDGSLQKEVNPQAITFAHKNNIKVIPLVNLVPSQDAILLNPSLQDKAIANLVQEVKANNYDGIDIDFEFLPVSGHKDFNVDRDQLTIFMKKLHAQMKNLGKETHMAVLPHIGTAQGLAIVYNYAELAPYVTRVALMCYDYKESSSPPGPVAPFSWVERNIATALQQGFRPEQISLGVATYGYDWPVNKVGGFARPSIQIMQQIMQKGYTVKWSNQYQEPYFTYTDQSGITREVWFENAATLQTKINLVKKYKISGISIWRLGYEDQKFWNKILSNWGKK
jgi:spore germination protein YaaH